MRAEVQPEFTGSKRERTGNSGAARLRIWGLYSPALEAGTEPAEAEETAAPLAGCRSAMSSSRLERSRFSSLILASSASIEAKVSRTASSS